MNAAPSTERRNYGDAIARSFHLRHMPHFVTRSLRSAQVALSRLRIGPAQFGLSPRVPAEDTFILALYLTTVPEHELYSRGRSFLRQGYRAGSIRIVNLLGEHAARVTAAHEALSIYIPRQALDEMADTAGMRRVAHLACPPGLLDPTLTHLAAALEPAFARPQEVNQLFIDHVINAMLLHVLARYGDGGRQLLAVKGGLSPRQRARAEAFLAAHYAADISLGELAEHCGLSRAHFARAFRQSAGISPHQWLLRYRVDRAKAMMLEGEESIAGVALACGFADQSHLTRVFTRLCGVSPAAWRREHRAGRGP
ncbi:helix-turn-helix domain-containing protein [Siccirubricoccus phaeus]|uniref:helix-turn-helix domain-containing protein n=1 Tax=Siccirubricoccus phaeus TaxID=2595053 RepID=UPI00165A67A8|nr:AraC family transcriptional regulator [Siccirubricoccus phaeus]